MIVGFNFNFRVPEVIHITCNMGGQDLSDMYALSPRASGIHIRQIPPAHVTTYTCNMGSLCIFKYVWLYSYWSFI